MEHVDVIPEFAVQPLSVQMAVNFRALRPDRISSGHVLGLAMRYGRASSLVE
jgi:hypothetical protein